MIDSSVHPDSYFSIMKCRNRNKMMDVMQGMKSLNEVCFLRVQGVSQLQKEIEETKGLPSKMLDM